LKKNQLPQASDIIESKV